MTVLYFTATGNNLYVAKTIGGTLASIPKAVREGQYRFSDDKIGLVFPIYGLAVPQFIREFLQKAHLDSPYIFAILSYGMIGGGAAGHLMRLADENGIHFSYVSTIQMVDNYLPRFEMGKQFAGEPKKKIDQHLAAIASDIHGGKQWLPKVSFVKRHATAIYMRFNPFATGAGLAAGYHVEDACNQCGICAKVCPTDNIVVADAKPVFSGTCVNCLACIHNCPQNAIHLSNEKSRARFRNQHVTLNEIIEANG